MTGVLAGEPPRELALQTSILLLALSCGSLSLVDGERQVVILARRPSVLARSIDAFPYHAVAPESAAVCDVEK